MLPTSHDLQFPLAPMSVRPGWVDDQFRADVCVHGDRVFVQVNELARSSDTARIGARTGR